MSHFSSIGFSIDSEQAFENLIEGIYQSTIPIQASTGMYRLYSDPSGGQIWLQLDSEGDIVGANPHFEGRSRRKVKISYPIEGQESPLDGAFHAWATEGGEGSTDTGEYPFFFDMPNFRSIHLSEANGLATIQLAAFAHEIQLYESEEAYDQSQEAEEVQYAAESFIPAGLFGNQGDQPEAMAVFTGRITYWEEKVNTFTGESFHWLLVATLGGEVDVLVDSRMVSQPPRINGIVSGYFWLTALFQD